MGLDTTHDCWHGAYSAFMRWRIKLAELAGLPPLELMEGFYVPISTHHGLPTLYHGIETRSPAYVGGEPFLARIDRLLPIKWDCLKPDALHKLLYHSDCDGEIPWQDCGAIADSLERLIPLMEDSDGAGHIGNWRDKTKAFVDGLRLAASKQENVEFH